RYRHDIGSMVYENDVFKDMSGVAQDIESDIIEAILCKIITNKGNHSWYWTIIYAANGGRDMNVTLDPKEHSVGSSSMTKDMIDFKECVNMIEVDDIASSEMFFTWTKNLYKTKSGDDTRILKKLDRAISNEAFV
nr:RNA-directed DNA polymerase, eukaryota, reverse transcriptase zinc-binding domain protein [Tanacetum cinerariifolium]